MWGLLKAKEAQHLQGYQEWKSIEGILRESRTFVRASVPRKWSHQMWGPTQSREAQHLQDIEIKIALKQHCLGVDLCGPCADILTAHSAQKC